MPRQPRVLPRRTRLGAEQSFSTEPILSGRYLQRTGQATGRSGNTRSVPDRVRGCAQERRRDGVPRTHTLFPGLADEVEGRRCRLAEASKARVEEDLLQAGLTRLRAQTEADFL